MWRPAGLRFGVAIVATLATLAACWSNKAGDGGGTIQNHHEALAQRDLAGAYWCAIEDGGYKYPPFPCAIRKIDQRLVLAKLGGSQRFEGEVRAVGQGFSFDGQFYCPWGDCTQELHGAFRPAANGALVGTFRDARFIVRMHAAPESAFGGSTYGGDGYGGFGGAAYGGAGYGIRYGGGGIHPNRSGRGNRRP
jgi:hypothetical protein